MSLRIAVALAAVVGAGILMPTDAEARSGRAVFRGNDSSAAAAAKNDKDRLYLAFNQATADGKASKRRARKPRDLASPPPAEATRDNSSGEVKFGAFPFDPMIPRR